jgi:hypothetical protein
MLLLRESAGTSHEEIEYLLEKEECEIVLTARY